VKAWNYAKQAVEASQNADVAVQYLEALEKQMNDEQKAQAKKVFEAAKKPATPAATK